MWIWSFGAGRPSARGKRLLPARSIERAGAFSIAALAVSLFTTDAVAQLPPASGPKPALSEAQRAIHLLSRTTYGVRPWDVDELVRVGRDEWLELQLNPERIDDGALFALLPNDTPGLFPSFPVAQSNSMTRSDTASLPGTGRLATGADQLVLEKLHRAAHTQRQLEEVMTDFWFNHFNVFYSKRAVGTSIPHYERTAIRQHVFGRFDDMLLAVARHPAMLIYLDNYLSATPGPESPMGGGVNENYARELLELHTLGVDGGYTEQDVVEVARAFTGWSVLMPWNPSMGDLARRLVPMPGTIEMDFRPEWHDAGAKVVLGRSLAPGRGVEDGNEVISILARHRSTAQHIATKLVRHFVADQPPADLVREIADVFLATDGDLREVTRALFTSDAFYRPEYYRAKVKRPFELVASTLRLTGTAPARTRAVPSFLQSLGHLPYMETAPTGFPTTADEWTSAGSMLSRVNFALDVGMGRYLESPIDPWAILGVAEGSAGAFRAVSAAGSERYDTRAVTRKLLQRFLVGVPATTLEESTVQHLALLDASDAPALMARALGLILGSPDFQRY